jgi:anti-anti-sigma regulatory factor
MIRIHQAYSTLLISFDKNDRLSDIDLRHLMREIVKKLKYPYFNILIDLKGIDEIDERGVRILNLGQRLSGRNNGQVSIFNASKKLLSIIHLQHQHKKLFFCDQLALAS